MSTSNEKKSAPYQLAAQENKRNPENVFEWEKPQRTQKEKCDFWRSFDPENDTGIM